jgi:molybdopterin converting factor small subunit
VVTFRIPSGLREHCDGQATVEVEAGDLHAALRELANRYPRCADRVLGPDGAPREWVRVEQEGDCVNILSAACGG